MEQTEALNTIVHSLLEERSLVDDPDWDTFAVLASVTPTVAEMNAYRYSGDEPGKPTPVRETGFQLFRDLQAATTAADGKSWEICIIKIDRDSRKGAVNFVYGDEAALWKTTPANASRIAENLRPQPADFMS
jgi:hypothetical protein